MTYILIGLLVWALVRQHRRLRRAEECLRGIEALGDMRADQTLDRLRSIEDYLAGDGEQYDHMPSFWRPGHN